MTEQAPIRTADWWDVYHFDTNDVRLTCPDCDEMSPEFEDIWAAIQWVHEHGKKCEA